MYWNLVLLVIKCLGAINILRKHIRDGDLHVSNP